MDGQSGLWRLRGAVAALVLLASAGGARAHHSVAMFDAESPRVLAGVVKTFEYTNPHSYLQLLVATRSGKVQEWSIELNGIAVIRREGIAADTFRPGEQLAVKIFPLKSGVTGGAFVEATRADGEIVSAAQFKRKAAP